MYLNNNQNVGIFLLFVVSHVVVKMVASFAAKNESRLKCNRYEERRSLLNAS